ncbi:MAG: RdgB/HAM1 family non-canonical purine NTP pyrophosphatase [Roseburia sp.]|nr:RdgB/HAM1 family non-canonical purine NTP pyrophosphatase [Roseburia sp.]
MKKIVLATGNKGKLEEFREMLPTFDVVSPKELGVAFDVEETGANFYENALIKARALYDVCKMPTLADDSGLCVDALGGAPGIMSARYSGGTDVDNINKLLSELDGITNRSAHFACCIVYFDGRTVVEATGEAHGRIALAPEGNGGFGYDPIFISDDLNKTFAVASAREKNAVSHRARALAALKSKLEGRAD